MVYYVTIGKDFIILAFINTRSKKDRTDTLIYVKTMVTAQETMMDVLVSIL
jgi:hypothetical protein